jgi:hypothetical protein
MWGLFYNFKKSVNTCDSQNSPEISTFLNEILLELLKMIMIMSYISLKTFRAEIIYLPMHS